MTNDRGDAQSLAFHAAFCRRCDAVFNRELLRSDERRWKEIKAERDAEAEWIAYGGCHD